MFFHLTVINLDGCRQACNRQFHISYARLGRLKINSPLGIELITDILISNLDLFEEVFKQQDRIHRSALLVEKFQGVIQFCLANECRVSQAGPYLIHRKLLTLLGLKPLHRQTRVADQSLIALDIELTVSVKRFGGLDETIQLIITNAKSSVT